ncbi:tyrosine-type recombinase/integrase [Methylocapsa palsarum]|uniref:tyrosine-type recombinase/integrase n=1 Tax=Methylocapsa palsarum TaxID=1612308 RepID=UPI001587CFFA|nr:site-specific integrase [Methylocapsa palsarum]
MTDRTLRGLKPAPAGKRTVIWDTAVPSLCVRVTDTGAASFNVMRRLKGRIIRRMVGISWRVPFPAGQPLPYSLSDARNDARSAILDISRGIDPKAAREAAKEAETQAARETFSALAKEFLADHVSSLRSAREVEAAFKNELLPVFGKKPIAEISDVDIVRLVKGISKDRPYQARHIFAYLSKFFAWAAAHRYVKASPFAGLKAKDLLVKPSARLRILNDDELAALWRATAALPYPSGPFVRLLLLTGQRLREVAEMAWSEVDIDKAVWTIPADRMKADAPHIVPLAPEAVVILKSLPRWTGPFVFSTTGGHRPIANFSGIKEKADALLTNIENWRFHDLRRTMRTGLSALRIVDTVSELCIAHTQKGLHRIYDQHSYIDEKRHAFEAWGCHVVAVCEPNAPSNIIRMNVGAAR